MSVDANYEQLIQDGCLEQGSHLAFYVAQQRGYDIPAWHGTYSDFDEFQSGDIGFHFAKDRRCALNRMEDTFCEHLDGSPHLIHVALSFSNPLRLNCDLNGWQAHDIVSAACMKLTGIPYESPSSIYLKDQKVVAQGAYALLKSIGIDNGFMKEMHGWLKSQKEGSEQWRNLNLNYTTFIRSKVIQSPYDAIIYKNDYEAEDGIDPTCYIVFKPNQVKSLDPTYDDDGGLMPLSRRFDVNSSRFTM